MKYTYTSWIGTNQKTAKGMLWNKGEVRDTARNKTWKESNRNEKSKNIITLKVWYVVVKNICRINTKTKQKIENRRSRLTIKKNEDFQTQRNSNNLNYLF